MVDKTNSIGKWISILYRYGQSYVSGTLDQNDIGKGQYVILLTLFRNGGVKQEELSEHLKLDKGTVARSLKKMERASLVERISDPGDKRANKVYLTKKGLDLVPLVKNSIENWESILLSDFTGDEKETIVRLIRKMAKNAYFSDKERGIEHEEN